MEVRETSAKHKVKEAAEYQIKRSYGEDTIENCMFQVLKMTLQNLLRKGELNEAEGGNIL